MEQSLRYEMKVSLRHGFYIPLAFLITFTEKCSNMDISLLASLYNPIVNPAMVSTVRFYDRNELYGSPDGRNCRMPNFLG